MAKKTSPPTRRGSPRFTSEGNGSSYNDVWDDEDEDERPKRKNVKKKKKKGPPRRWFWAILLRLIVLGLIGGGIGYFYITYDLPDISTLGDVKKNQSIIIKSEDGTVLGTYGDVYGEYVPYSQLPKSLINAVVATEDRNFFHHFGIDPIGLLRATFVNMRARHLVQGGSTITQQLAKNVFLSPDRTLKRKLQEMVLAVRLEHRFTKEQILTIYLNRVYMGAGNYGVDAASRRYFGHPVQEVTLPEAAMLVGLLKAPSRYAPTSNPDRSEQRAIRVLLNMQDAGYLTAEEVTKARGEFGDEDAAYRDVHGFGLFYFTDWIMGQLPEIIGDNKDDIVVTTTVRPDFQREAEDAVTDIMNTKGKNLRASQAAVFSMTPDGAIRAMVGGRNYRVSQFNRVTQAQRQPGSSFKLFVYLAGIEAGFGPDSQMEDKAITVDNWHPRDYTGKYLGVMTLREAFAESINSIAIQLSEAVGRDKVVAMAERLGITSPLAPDPSIALGSSEVTLFDMTKAYANLASGGMSVHPYAISKIETTRGKVIFTHTPTTETQTLTAPVVHAMNNMLLAVTTHGTGRGAQIGRPVAGKTGTTSDYRDAWFIGFTPQLVTGVWVGNDDHSMMKKVSGAGLPASIWHNYMMEAMKGVPVVDIPNDAGSAPQGTGFFSTIFSSGPTQPAATPLPNQNTNATPFGKPTPAPAATPVPAIAPLPAQAAPPPEPEEQPTPNYDAPQSFWDKLMDNGNKSGQ